MIGTDNAIEVRNVKKYFKVYYDRGITVKDKILSRGRSRYEKREVLKDITFNVKKGEAIGLIGKNGCGKSTMLKLLTRIIYPNEGSVEIKGRVSSLLELGAGFHPDMSGKENIYMNAAVFGLNRKEIDKRVDNIIKFSELEEFIDNPVRTYSSGMYMRLAFSVAINVDAEILLIDEILAVGDVSFQKKCFEKLNDIKVNGTTIVIVSHSLDQIEKICDRTIWIENGVIKEMGNPKVVSQNYLEEMEQTRLERFQFDLYEELSEEPESESENGNCQVVEEEQESAADVLETEAADMAEQEINGKTDTIEEIQKYKKNLLNNKNDSTVHKGTGEVQFTEMYVTDSYGNEKVYFETGDEINVFLKYKCKKENLKGTFCFLIYRDDGLYYYGTNTFIEKMEVMELNKAQHLKIVLHDIPLLPGKYFFTLAIHNEQAINYDFINKAVTIQIFSNKGEQGISRVVTDWYIGKS